MIVIYILIFIFNYYCLLALLFSFFKKPQKNTSYLKNEKKFSIGLNFGNFIFNFILWFFFENCNRLIFLH